MSNEWEEEDFSVIPDADDVDSTGNIQQEAVPNEQQGNAQQQPQQVAPVKMGKKKTSFIFIVFVLLIALVLLVIRQGSFTRKNDSVGQNYNVEQGGNQSTSQEPLNNGSEGMNSSLNSPENQVPVSVGEGEYSNPTVDGYTVQQQEQVVNGGQNPVQGTNQGVPQNNGQEAQQGYTNDGTQQVNPQVDNEPQVVQQGTIVENVVPVEAEPDNEFSQLTLEPALGAEVLGTGMVKGLYMYQIGNSYTYGVNLVIITGNDAYIECYYFCPRKTYSALAIGDSLQVTYQQDSMGNVSVVSISK